VKSALKRIEEAENEVSASSTVWAFQERNTSRWQKSWLPSRPKNGSTASFWTKRLKVGKPPEALQKLIKTVRWPDEEVDIHYAEWHREISRAEQEKLFARLKSSTQAAGHVRKFTSNKR